MAVVSGWKFSQKVFRPKWSFVKPIPGHHLRRLRREQAELHRPAGQHPVHGKSHSVLSQKMGKNIFKTWRENDKSVRLQYKTKHECLPGARNSRTKKSFR
jgi:hypothetical protein